MAFVSPIGVSDFKALRSSKLLYANKTRMVVGLSSRGTQVTLFPRPRRFGKTLSLSMLLCVFEPSDKDCYGRVTENSPVRTSLVPPFRSVGRWTTNRNFPE